MNLPNDVSVACQIAEAQGLGHSFLGHVSARHPGEETIQVKPAGIGLGEVRSRDVITVGLDGRQITGSRGMHAEMPIHLGIYKQRPDVNAVIHTHPLHVAGLMASDGSLEMVNQDSLYFAEGIGHHPSPALIVTDELGDALATSLGPHRAVLMKNHGLVTVGRTVQEAVFLAVALEASLRVQAMALNFGKPSPIPADELDEMLRHFEEGYDRRVATTWDYMSRLLPRLID